MANNSDLQIFLNQFSKNIEVNDKKTAALYRQLKKSSARKKIVKTARELT